MFRKGLRFAVIMASMSLWFTGVALAAGPSGGKVVHLTVEGADLRRGGPGVVGKAPATAAPLTGSLIYRGAVAGVGVTTGAPKVYLVFWGSQWGTAGTDAKGNITLTGDKNGAAPYLQNFFKGLGGTGDAWSNVMTYSCETVAGATTCPATAQHVGYPTGGALAGVWVDPAGIISTKPTTNDADIAREALAAAQHFGNLTPASNRNVQYVIVSPPGTHPGGFSPTAGWCAWHDWNGDTTMNGGAVASSYGNFAFTNLPYVTDLGASCGQNYVNATTGLLDGFSLVGGHEYSETITDQFPAGGWTDSTGYENADKCSWIGTNMATGGAGNITLSTGTFPVQGQWLNDINGCATTYATAFSPSSPTNVITLASSPTGPISAALGAAISPVTVTATGTASPGAYSFTATGLPTGLVISASGTISGTPSKAGSYTAWITAADGNKAVGYGSLVFNVIGNTVTVTPPSAQSSIKGVPITSVTASATSTGGGTSFSWTVTGYPAGITATLGATTVTFSGTPTTAQSAKAVTLTAKDATGATGSASFNWTVLTTTVTVNAIAGQSTTRGTAVAPITATAKDSNPAITTFTWSATGLPTGLTINATTGVISGTVSTTATVKTYTVKVTAIDANGSSGSTSFSWIVK